MNLRASLTREEEDTDSCSDTTSQPSVNLDSASDSTSSTSSQSSSNSEDLSDGSASESSFEEGSQASRVREGLQADAAINSDSDADSQASSKADDTDTRSQGSIESCMYGDKHSNRLFTFYRHIEGPRMGSNWCSLSLNHHWYYVDRNYHEYTGKDFWGEVIAFLNAAEPAFEARFQPYYDDCEFHLHVSTPRNAHVKHLKQLLVELEPRYKGYSVAKLTRLARATCIDRSSARGQ